MIYERVHIGEIIKSEVLAKVKSISSFSESIGIHRQNIERTVFQKRSIDTDLLITISEILEIDFFQYYKQISKRNKKDYTTNTIDEESYPVSATDRSALLMIRDLSAENALLKKEIEELKREKKDKVTSLDVLESL